MAEWKDPWRPRLLRKPGDVPAPQWLVLSGAERGGDPVLLSGGAVDQHPMLLSSNE